jgi:hypothetical protein
VKFRRPEAFRKRQARRIRSRWPTSGHTVNFDGDPAVLVQHFGHGQGAFSFLVLWSTTVLVRQSLGKGHSVTYSVLPSTVVYILGGGTYAISASKDSLSATNTQGWLVLEKYSGSLWYVHMSTSTGNGKRPSTPSPPGNFVKASYFAQFPIGKMGTWLRIGASALCRRVGIVR